MTRAKRIHLNGGEFSIQHFGYDEDVELTIRLRNGTMARKVMAQILRDQKHMEIHEELCKK